MQFENGAPMQGPVGNDDGEIGHSHCSAGAFLRRRQQRRWPERQTKGRGDLPRDFRLTRERGDIFLKRAKSRFGLRDIHQLRGRASTVW